MLCAKYDYDLDIQVKQAEAFAMGFKQGLQKAMQQQGIVLDSNQERIYIAKEMLEIQIDELTISVVTQLSENEIKKLKN